MPSSPVSTTGPTTTQTTTMLRSERAVETLETSAAAIDREIEAVEAATTICWYKCRRKTRRESRKRGPKKEERRRKTEKTSRRETLGGFKRETIENRKRVGKALEVAKVERREHEKEETKKKKDVNAAALLKKNRKLSSKTTSTSTPNWTPCKRERRQIICRGGTNGTEETERERLIRIGEMTPFDRLDGFDKARTDEAEEVKKKKGSVAKREIEIKDDRCERCTETDGENAFESDWGGDFETRETDEKWGRRREEEVSVEEETVERAKRTQQNKRTVLRRRKLGEHHFKHTVRTRRKRKKKTKKKKKKTLNQRKMTLNLKVDYPSDGSRFR